ncbi:MAG: hypothetical protein AB7U20_01340 [Planctomycetaceae bacterium]
MALEMSSNQTGLDQLIDADRTLFESRRTSTARRGYDDRTCREPSTLPVGPSFPPMPDAAEARAVAISYTDRLNRLFKGKKNSVSPLIAVRIVTAGESCSARQVIPILRLASIHAAVLRFS